MLLFKRLLEMRPEWTFFVFMILVILPGCSVMQPLQTATDVVYVYNTSGQVIKEFQSIDMSEEDRLKVSDSLSVIAQEKERFDLLISNPENVPLYTTMLPKIYEKVKPAYLSLRDVALRNEDKMDIDLWTRLSVIDNTMYQYDQDFTKLVDIIRFNSYLDTTVKLVSVFVKP